MKNQDTFTIETPTKELLSKEFIISIDMGGTKILGAVLNSEKGIITRVKKSTNTKANKNIYPKLLFEVITELLEQTNLKEEDIKAVCLGVPGSVNPETGLIALAPNLGLKNYNIKKGLEQYTNIPVLIENDVNLAALGIKNFGYGKDIENLLVVFIGTGIGSGLIINNKIYRGSSYAAGEIGHILVDSTGPICGCGKKGCFEAIASRSAIVRDIEKEIKKGAKSILSKNVKDKIPIKSRALANALQKNDKLTIKYISHSCEIIGEVLSNINNLLNFEMIVLGGGLIEACSKFMLPKIKESFKENSLKESAKGIKILATKLGDDAALYGGIALAKEFL